MEDLFYKAYEQELNNRNVGKFTFWQLVWCWFLLFWMIILGIALLWSYVYDSNEYVAGSLIAYVLVAMVLGLSLSLFEKKSQNRTFQGNQEDRIKGIRATIDSFLLSGKYDEKITFLTNLYERAIKQREEREKTFRRAFIYILSAFGVIFTNVVDSPDNTAWKTILYVALTLVIIVGLAIGPILFAGAFDSKKKTYNYMYVELQAVKLMQGDIVSSEGMKTTSSEEQGKNTEAKS